MIGCRFADPGQRADRRLILAPFNLQLGLSQEYGHFRLGLFFPGHQQPVVPTLVGALGLRRSRRGEIVEQRRFATLARRG